MAPISQSAEYAALLDRILAGETDGVGDLRAFHERNPEDLKVLGDLAYWQAVAGLHEESIATAEKFLALRPDDQEMRLTVGDRLINLGRTEEAKDVYQRVATEDPENHGAKAGLQFIAYLERKALGTGRAPKAIPHVAQSLSEKQRDNLERNRAELRRDPLRLQTMPTHLYLESTTKCNFACQTCDKGYGTYYAEDVHRDVLNRVREEVMPYATEISISGFGEPTLADDFDEILEMALDHNAHVYFTTNASLLSMARIEQLTKTRAGISVSIDGGTEETFERVRIGGSFDKTLERLALVQRLRRIHLSEGKSHWAFNAVALRVNLEELEEIVRLAHRFSIGHVNIEDYAVGHGAFDDESPRNDPVRANECMARAKRVAEELGVRLTCPPPYDEDCAPTSSAPLAKKVKASGGLFPKRNRLPQKCAHPWNNPYIHTDGSVVPCCTSNFHLGSVKNTPFKKVWNGWRYRLLRWRIHSVMPPLDCRKCFVHYGINAGNPGNVIAQEGLIIRGLYWIEYRVRHWSQRLNHWLRRRSAPKPNYAMGKPMKAEK